MKILDTSLSLLEIEKLLEVELSKEENEIGIIGDLGISYEDYNCLMVKLKKLLKNRSSISLLMKYKLCITTAWIFGLKYEGKTNYFGIRDMIAAMPQHQIRHSLNILCSVFEEYGFESTSSKNMASFDGLFSLIQLNSGIQEEKQVI